MQLDARSERCPVCSGALRGWADKQTSHGLFHIDRCAECGHGFVNPRPSAESLREFYAESGHGEGGAQTLEALVAREERYPNSTADAARMVGRLRAFGAAGRLLDVGCGWGFFSREAKAQGFEVVALELGRQERENARTLAGIEAIDSTFEDYRPEAPFGAILLSQVLEHVRDVNVWMEKARSALAPGGVMAVALPSFDSAFRVALGARDPYVTPPAHLNFFTHRSLTKLVEKHGFQVLEVEDVTRLPADVVAKRLPIGDGTRRKVVEGATALAAGAFALAANRLGAGVMLNLYARAP